MHFEPDILVVEVVLEDEQLYFKPCILPLYTRHVFIVWRHQKFDPTTHW